MSAQSALSSPESLKLFVMTAQHGSIAAGARAINMEPSLATRKMAQLESALNARLFERTTRSTRLTEAGTVALRWAVQALEQQDQIVDDLAAMQVKPAGLIRLVTTQYAASEYLPPILASFSAQHPAIQLSIRTTDAQVNLVDGQFDVAVHPGLILNSSFVGQLVMQFHRVLCATPEYLARRGMPTTPAALAEHDCLAHALNEPRIWHFSKGKSILVQKINPLMEFDNYAVLLSMTRHSLGIARLSHTLVRADIESGRLVQLLPDYPCIHPHGEQPALRILYPSRKVLHRTRLLIDHLMHYLPKVDALRYVKASRSRG